MRQKKLFDIPPGVDPKIDINIRLSKVGEQLSMTLIGKGLAPEVRQPLRLTELDLAGLNDDLQSKLDDITQSNEITRLQSAADIRHSIRELAEAGRLAYLQIFGGPQVVGGSGSLAWGAIESLLAFKGMIRIEISSRDCFVPWELLYSEDITKPISVNNFWGMKYVISRNPILETYQGGYAWPQIVVDPRPKIGMATDTSLQCVLEREKPFFENLSDTGLIDLEQLEELNPSPQLKSKQISKLKEFLSNSYDIIHIAGHAENRGDGPGKVVMRIDNGFYLSVSDVELYQVFVHIPGKPLVTLNACKTGGISAVQTWSFVRSLLQAGARGVVATECSVPDSFAADFAQKLYEYILDYRELGQSLLLTRRYFFWRYRNLSGLLYVLFGPPSIRLERKES